MIRIKIPFSIHKYLPMILYGIAVSTKSVLTWSIVSFLCEIIWFMMILLLINIQRYEIIIIIFIIIIVLLLKQVTAVHINVIFAFVLKFVNIVLEN